MSNKYALNKSPVWAGIVPISIKFWFFNKLIVKSVLAYVLLMTKLLEVWAIYGNYTVDNTSVLLIIKA